MSTYAHLIIVTDCGGTDEGRYKIGARRCFYPNEVQVSFIPTASKNTLHTGFIAAAHALSTVDHFGRLQAGENIGLLVNAAPRYGAENGVKFRGSERNKDGEEIYALKLKSGVWVVGPNAGFNFYFLKQQIRESYLVIDQSGMETPFRSLEVMVPALAKVMGINDFPDIVLKEKKLQIQAPSEGLYVADWDDHGNIYVFSNLPDEQWLPQPDGNVVFKINNEIGRMRHVDGIFAGHTGELTLTTGSLKLGGRHVYYIVSVGSSAHAHFARPEAGTPIYIESE